MFKGEESEKKKKLLETGKLCKEDDFVQKTDGRVK